MDDVEIVCDIIRNVGIAGLGKWDGCCCSGFQLRGIDIDISCGKGRQQAVWLSVPYNGDILEGSTELRPIMDEVIAQLKDFSGRGGTFAEFFRPWSKD